MISNGTKKFLDNLEKIGLSIADLKAKMRYIDISRYKSNKKHQEIINIDGVAYLMFFENVDGYPFGISIRKTTMKGLRIPKRKYFK